MMSKYCILLHAIRIIFTKRRSLKTQELEVDAGPRFLASKDDFQTRRQSAPAAQNILRQAVEAETGIGGLKYEKMYIQLFVNQYLL